MSHPTGVTAGVVERVAEARIPGRGYWGRFADALAARLTWLGTGGIAELRRIDERHTVPTFWQVAGDLAVRFRLWPETGPLHPDQEQKLAVCVGALAWLMYRGRHTAAVPFGRALYHIGCSKITFAQLMQARDEQLLRLVLRLCKDLGNAQRGADFRDVLRLVWERDRRADRIRSKIAMNYFVRRESLVEGDEQPDL